MNYLVYRPALHCWSNDNLRADDLSRASHHCNPAQDKGWMVGWMDGLKCFMHYKLTLCSVAIIIRHLNQKFSSLLRLCPLRELDFFLSFFFFYKEKKNFLLSVHNLLMHTKPKQCFVSRKQPPGQVIPNRNVISQCHQVCGMWWGFLLNPCDLNVILYITGGLFFQGSHQWVNMCLSHKRKHHAWVWCWRGLITFLVRCIHSKKGGYESSPWRHVRHGHQKAQRLSSYICPLHPLPQSSTIGSGIMTLWGTLYRKADMVEESQIQPSLWWWTIGHNSAAERKQAQPPVM